MTRAEVEAVPLTERLVVVAFVEVELTIVRLVMVLVELLARMPPVSVESPVVDKVPLKLAAPETEMPPLALMENMFARLEFFICKISATCPAIARMVSATAEVEVASIVTTEFVAGVVVPKDD